MQRSFDAYANYNAVSVQYQCNFNLFLSNRRKYQCAKKIYLFYFMEIFMIEMMKLKYGCRNC